MKSNKIMLASAVIFGLIAAFGVYWYVENLEKQMDETEYVQVIVPQENIQANTQVTRNMFRYMEIPAEYIHPEAITNPEEIDGAITKTMLMADEQLLRGKIVVEEQYEAGLAYQIKEGFRALTIPINQVSGLAGLVKPGDSVDIIVTINAERGTGESVLISTYVLQDILVLAADNVLEREKSDVNPLERNTLTLEVRPTDAPKLVMASEEGSLRLLLRSPIDEGTTNTAPASLRSFIQ